MLQSRWGEKPLAVHTVGFSSNCDRELLESMRTAGQLEGVYRYAEQGDDDDALCQKLTGIYEVSSEASSVPVDFKLNQHKHALRFPVSSMKCGHHRLWADLSCCGLSAIVNTVLDKNVEVPVVVLPPSEFVMSRWLSHLADGMASEVLGLSKIDLSPNIRELNCALLLQVDHFSSLFCLFLTDPYLFGHVQRIEAVQCEAEEPKTAERLAYIAQQVEEIRKNKQVNLGKLSDMRFGSVFEKSKVVVLVMRNFQNCRNYFDVL